MNTLAAPKKWSKEKAYFSVNFDGILPGTLLAKEHGCTCSGNRQLYRDGWGYEVSGDCYMHANLPELAE